jgi:2-amino-4-hydroxy-6-hydroxymethyldihydropteridine diphosphokinase
MVHSYVSLGSNLGDRAGYLRDARAALARLPTSNLTAASAVYQTDPVGPIDQGPFLNAVVGLDTAIEPEALLDRLLAIERIAGRVRAARWGPRTLDLDLLLYGDRVIQTDRLTVPHPHMHERAFVLVPLAQIAGDLVHPTAARTINQLLAAVDRAGVVRTNVDGWPTRGVRLDG